MKSGSARTFEGSPPESAGRPHEAGGNAGPRWMAVSPAAARRPGDRTRRTARLVCRLGPMTSVIAGQGPFFMNRRA